MVSNPWDFPSGENDKGVFCGVNEVMFRKPLGHLGREAPCQGTQSCDWRVRASGPTPQTLGKGEEVEVKFKDQWPMDKSVMTM